MNKQEIIDRLNKWAKSRNINFIEYDDYNYANSYRISENVLELTHDIFYWEPLDFFLLKELYNTFIPKNIQIEVNGRDEIDVNIIFESNIT